MAEKEEEPRQSLEEIRYMAQLYNDRYTALNTEIKELVADLGSLSNSKKTLEEFDFIKGRKILTPISNIMQIFSTAEASDKVLVSVGGGYILEKSIAEAQQFLDKMLDGKNRQLASMSKEKDTVENILLRLSYTLSRV
jgi:prefoldin alpha subunit